MKWVPFTILAIIAIVLQTSVVRYVEIQSIRPDLVLVLAVHYALWGPWPEAAIAGWLMGLLVDLQSSEPDRIGLHAFCFGGAAWLILRVRQVVFREHAVTQFLVTLASCLLIQVVVGLYHRWGRTVLGGGFWSPVLLTALYTALLAPYVHWLLIRLGRWTGLRPTHRLSTVY